MIREELVEQGGHAGHVEEPTAPTATAAAAVLPGPELLRVGLGVRGLWVGTGGGVRGPDGHGFTAPLEDHLLHAQMEVGLLQERTHPAEEEEEEEEEELFKIPK